jgi:hypothetical protein
MMPMVLPDGETGGMAPGAGAPGIVIAGWDIVLPADAGLGETPATGRDIVDEVDGAAGAAAPTTGRGPVAEADAAAPTAGRDPVAEADAAPAAGRDPVAEADAAPTAGRDPVAEADAGEAGFGAVIPVALAGGTAPGAAEGAVPAPAAATSVVPHCTQNFAPG